MITKLHNTERIKPSINQQGFTIMELMIATIVFGVVLITVTVAIMQFTRVYYKGITEATVQDTARTITDQIAQGIQFNGGNVSTTVASPAPGGSYAFCVGNTQYSYTTGFQLEDTPSATQTYHALVSRVVAGCTGSTPAQNVRAATVSGREMLAPHMRLSRLQVTHVSGDLYKISVRIVYGDVDLLNNPTAANASCKNLPVGGQFCAVSDITTTVVKRVE
jgi:prepilin-type N-terminal cleavage/methylation domain-containing protein